MVAPAAAARSDSAIGYVGATLVDPVPASTARGDSPVGFVRVTMVAPTAPATGTDSLIGFTAVTMRVPHRPVLVLTASGYKRSVIRVFDGTTWR
jgi:hypothetical protein